MDVKSEDSASPEGEYAEEGEQATASSSASVLDPETKKGKVVIEAFPGPGALTRALMRLPKERIRRLIVLEENEMYYEYLKPLEDLDPRVKILKKSGYAWDTYEVIEENGWLDDVKKAPWDVVQTDLQFISHVPTNIMGEQLVAQFFRCIPDRQWLFKYGRMPMSIVLGAWMWKRLSAAPGTAERCKVSVIAEAVSTFTSSLPPSTLLPYEEHFHPVFSRESRQSKPELRKHGSPLLSINILPFAKQPIEKGALEKWDFCLRRLFVLKSTPIGKAIGSLAPGATTLIQYLSDESLPAEERLDLKKPIKQLTVHDWSLVLRAFERWPFAPEVRFA
ncbi:S-adenosyl-L-methionine-dependent methyltransferase [Gloeophyllum trabeum ATCC 11539]|uniref:rRNA adenine N(6)-methyltransferase n=1 Tax=Gloeophyllum trabeum (strain ATCC 11539 / FP-39264 / Madison 617) TaxID=670483 RepID=S7RR38_GLOTA|nr:S-adenosyl-L-methionine-dependent methyltransferase [Gloeophyllum trabeum ATCC 11539]EPQ57060.1 S-adenosyl-L-methionine-dependent methyltransferase [Gloeophyllum trabeum ATCC 11539]